MPKRSATTTLRVLAFVAFLCLIKYYDTMPASPEPEVEPMTLDEYVVFCAELHNALLAKSIPSDSPPAENAPTDLLQAYESHRTSPVDLLDGYPGGPPTIDPLSPLATLLPLLKTTIPVHRGNPDPFTPLLYQPTPEWFFPPLYAYEFESPAVLLYPQRLPSDEPFMDGGLFVEIDTLYAAWRAAPALHEAMENWVPLDYILRVELSRWESGRSIHGKDGPQVQKWLPAPSASPDAPDGAVTTPYPNLQVAQALSAWTRLLTVIESKLPPETPRGRDDPLPLDATADLSLSAFARHFLTLAPRPKGWSFIAPGIGTFTPSTLRAAYADEPRDSFRLTFVTTEEGDDWVSLVLPFLGDAAHVPTDVGDSPDREISGFDTGFGKATVGRRAGVYITWADEMDGNLVTVVEPSGRTDGVVFEGVCQWGPPRDPRLAEVLEQWVWLVEEGVWKVGAEGVEGGGEWWEGNLEARKLSWDDVEP